jgi:hypothetical protein
MAINQGQPIVYRDTSTEYHPGIVAGNITSTTADVIAFTNGDSWSGGQTRDSWAIPQWGCTMGSGVGEWLPVTTSPYDPPTPQPALTDTFTVTNNSRTIGTAFQPSATRPTLVSFSVRVVSGLTLSGGAAGRVELRSDSGATPSTVRARVAGGATGTVVVGISMSDTAEGTMTYLVPAGHYVLLQSVNETGTPTYSITAQYEIVL